MANPITIPERREPTLWNRYALTGARVGLLAVMGLVALTAVSGALGPSMPLIGGALGDAASALLANASGWVLGLGASAAGFMVGVCAYAGGLSGLNEVEHNKVSGRTVHPPTLLNEGIGHGLMDGLLLGAAAITATALILPALASTAFTTAMLAFVGGGALIGTGFLSYYRADAQRDAMAKDYMVAQQQAMAQGKGIGAPEASLSHMLEGLAHSKAHGVSADDMQQLSGRLREGRGAQSAVERLETERNQQAMLSDVQR